MDLAAVKRRLRIEIRDRILAMPPTDRHREEETLVDRFLDLPGFASSETVLLYVSAFPEEFATWPMLRAALSLGKRLICPRVVRREQRLALFEVKDLNADLVSGTLGIFEPRKDGIEVSASEIDWVLVPGLGFDTNCYRIGRGAGHYDRLLTALRPEVARWSLCLTSQWVEALPIEPHDQRLDGVADAQRVISRA